MNQEQIKSTIDIANKHIERMEYARNKLNHFVPFTAENVAKLTPEEIAMIELFTNRFAKLQDLMGRKLFDFYFLAKEEDEDPESWTMIDKLNKLEKLRILDDAGIWKKMRKLSNHLAHEYPDDPGHTADNLNKIFAITPELLLICNNIVAGLQ